MILNTHLKKKITSSNLSLKHFGSFVVFSSIISYFIVSDTIFRMKLTKLKFISTLLYHSNLPYRTFLHQVSSHDWHCVSVITLTICTTTDNIYRMTITVIYCDSDCDCFFLSASPIHNFRTRIASNYSHCGMNRAPWIRRSPYPGRSDRWAKNEAFFWCSTKMSVMLMTIFWFYVICPINLIG